MHLSHALAALVAPSLVVLIAASPVVPPAVSLVVSEDVSIRGCSARPESAEEDIRDWGLAIDGELVATHDNGDSDVADLRDFVPDLSTVRHAQVVCWAAVERMYDVRLRRGIYAVWTRDVFEGAAPFLESALAHARGGGDVLDLTPPDPELVVTVTEISDDGALQIDVTHPKWQRMCRIASVSIPSDPASDHVDERRASTAEVPACFSLHDHGGSGA